MKNLIRKWLGLPVPISAVSSLLSCSPQPVLEPHEAKTRIEVFDALNGRILQIGKFKPNPHGPDWAFRLYIVPDGQPLPDAIATALVVGGAQ